MAKVATPTASPVAGAQLTAPTVTLTCATVGSTIFYTTDGTSPTHTAGVPSGTTQIYATPLTTTLPETIKALGYLVSDTDSNVLTATYQQGYTLSGSLGAKGAGAVVFITQDISGGTFAGLWPTASMVTADGSGNYTSGALLPNPFNYQGSVGDGSVVSYLVTPAIFGSEFTPFSQSVTMSAANQTGINFSFASAYKLVPVYSDSFNTGGVGQNPITGWTTVSDDSALQIGTANAAEASTDASICGAYPTAYTETQADSYCQFTLVAENKSDTLVLNIRADSSAAAAGYDFEMVGTLGTANTGAVQLLDTGANAPLMTGIGYVSYPGTPPYEFHVGDIMTLMARGNNVYMFWTSGSTTTPVAAGSSTTSPNAGLSVIQINTVSATLSRTSVSNFVAGNVEANNVNPGAGASGGAFAGYGTDISAVSEITSNPAGETNSSRTSIIGTNRGSRFIG